MAAVLAGVASFGMIRAAAATLGGVTSTGLGADVSVVASCDTDGMATAFTNTYDSTLGRYQTTTVTVSGIAAGCSTKVLNLTLKDSTGASLGNGTVASISGTSAAVTISTPGANATAVSGVAIVVTG